MKSLYFAGYMVVSLLAAYTLPGVCTMADDAPVASPTSMPWGPEVGGVVVAATVDRDHVAFGEPLTLTVTVKNVGTQPINLVTTDPLMRNQIEVVLANHSPSALTAYGQRLANPGLGNRAERLGPQQTYAKQFPLLTRTFDMTLNGKYTITVKRWISNEITVTSVPLTVVLEDHPAPTTKPAGP